MARFQLGYSTCVRHVLGPPVDLEVASYHLREDVSETLGRRSRIIVQPQMRLYLERFDSGQLPHSSFHFAP